MNISGVGLRSQLAVQSFVEMRRQLDDLQRQLGTGQKSVTHAGLGMDRGLAVSLRGQLSALDSFAGSMTLVKVRLDVAQTALTRMTDIRADAKAALGQSPDVKAHGQSVAQQSAHAQLDELIELLQSKAGDRYVFGGRAVDKPPTATTAQILDGDGTAAGLRQVIAERAAADLGADGMGRLVTAVAGDTMTLGEDVDGSPFGFKLAAATADFSGATVTGPAGTPPQIAVSFGTNPNPGESLTVTLDLPDGSRETITLTATDQDPPGPGSFTIGADPDDTAANLHAALGTAVGKAANTSLAAASALAASDDFFNIDHGKPPLRVDGPPFETATAQVAGTPADTVFWYKGEMAADSARSSAVTRIDASVSVSYGVRGNEEGIRWVIQNVAAFAATSFDPNDPDTPARYAALTERLGPALAIPAGTAKVEDIAVELANAQVTIAATAERHLHTGHVLAGLLDEIEGIPPEEVAVQILALQTRLQASLQVTAMMSQLSLTNFI